MRSILLLLSLLTLGSPITAQQTDSLLVARPLEGEGIWSFLRRHQLDPATHLQDFKKLNEGRFDNNGGLYLHRDYLIPVVLKERKEPLFGAEHETVKLIDDRLKGAVFYLVSGHGGPDPGAIGHYGEQDLYEDEYAYDITLRLARRLMEHHATVHLIVQDTTHGIRSGTCWHPIAPKPYRARPSPSTSSNVCNSAPVSSTNWPKKKRPPTNVASKFTSTVAAKTSNSMCFSTTTPAAKKDGTWPKLCAAPSSKTIRNTSHEEVFQAQ
jgi:hypothetical protein